MIKKQNRYITNDFFNKAFKNYKVPHDIQRISIRICKAYSIQGICDPMYICNIIAQVLKREHEVINIEE
jgi:hypothetical protein